MEDIVADVSMSHLCDGGKEVYNLTGQIRAFELKQIGLQITKGRIEVNGLTNDTAGHAPHMAGGVSRTSTQPTLNLYRPPPPRMRTRIYPAGKPYSDLGQALVDNDPPARCGTARWSAKLRSTRSPPTTRSRRWAGAYTRPLFSST